MPEPISKKDLNSQMVSTALTKHLIQSVQEEEQEIHAFLDIVQKGNPDETVSAAKRLHMFYTKQWNTSDGGDPKAEGA